MFNNVMKMLKKKSNSEFFHFADNRKLKLT